MGTEQFCLKWNNHQNNMLAIFDQLLSNEAFVDVTLACEGLTLKAHKMILSACSPFFQSLFLENPCKHPIVILKDIKYSDLKVIVHFMYHGQVNVTQEQLSNLMKVAEMLQVKGLAELAEKNENTLANNEQLQLPPEAQAVLPELQSQGTHVQLLPNGKKRSRNRKRVNKSPLSEDESDNSPFRIKQQIDSSDDMDNTTAELQNISNESSLGPIPTHFPQPHIPPLDISNEDRKQFSGENSISNLIPSQPKFCRISQTSQEAIFALEPYNLMEQSMTTENAPIPPVSHEQPLKSLSKHVSTSSPSHSNSTTCTSKTIVPSKYQLPVSLQPHTSFKNDIKQDCASGSNRQAVMVQETTFKRLELVHESNLVNGNTKTFLHQSIPLSGLKHTSWTNQENSNQAVQAVLEGNWTLRKAAEYYQIPLATLWRRVQCAKNNTVKTQLILPSS